MHFLEEVCWYQSSAKKGYGPDLILKKCIFCKAQDFLDKDNIIPKNWL